MGLGLVEQTCKVEVVRVECLLLWNFKLIAKYGGVKRVKLTCFLLTTT